MPARSAHGVQRAPSETRVAAGREARITPQQPQCPVCRSEVEPAFLICPVCTTHLKEPCAHCAAPLEPLWQACPYCRTPVIAQPAAADLDAALTAEAARINAGKPRARRPRKTAASKAG